MEQPIDKTTAVSDELQNKAEEERILKEAKLKKKYFEVVGRRKTSTATVRLFTQGKKTIEVNGKPLEEVFPTTIAQKIITSPIEKLKCEGRFGFTCRVKGGGKMSQAGALRHGIARAFVDLNPYFRKRLKKLGYLMRDPRMKERRKPGLKKARKAPQWSKR